MRMVEPGGPGVVEIGKAALLQQLRRRCDASGAQITDVSFGADAQPKRVRKGSAALCQASALMDFAANARFGLILLKSCCCSAVLWLIQLSRIGGGFLR
jgi:hypothetical protein